MRTPAAPRRSVATASVALAVFTAGLTLAFVQAAHPASAATVPALELDRSLSVGAQYRVGLDNGAPTAYRAGASDVPRVYPLVSDFRNAVRGG